MRLDGYQPKRLTAIVVECSGKPREIIWVMTDIKEDIIMSNISTLKNAKVGDKVSMLTFTGMNLGQFEITKAGKTKLAVMKKDGTQAEFSRETGIQTNANNPKYANKIVDPIDEAAPKAEKKAAPAKKAAKKAEEEEAPKAEKKAPAKAAAKATKKTTKVEIPEDADDFEDEDLDDDFEDFDEE